MSLDFIEPVDHAPTKEDITRFEIVYCKHCNRSTLTCPVWNEMADAYRHQNKNDISEENIIRLIGSGDRIEIEPFFCRRLYSKNMYWYNDKVKLAIQCDEFGGTPKYHESTPIGFECKRITDSIIFDTVKKGDIALERMRDVFRIRGVLMVKNFLSITGNYAKFDPSFETYGWDNLNHAILKYTHEPSHCFIDMPIPFDIFTEEEPNLNESDN